MTLSVALSSAALAQSSAISWSAFETGGGVSGGVSSGQLRSTIDQTFSVAAIHGDNSQVATGFFQGTKTGGTSAVKPNGPTLPRTYSLEQNYPNPFNPTTIIRYALPQTSHITLTVYNVLGQQVAELVDRVMEAGYHEVTFNAAGFASGVYFYRLTAGDFAQTRRLVLLK